MIAGQLVQLAQEVPGYQANLQEKIKAIKFIGGPDGLIGRTSEMIQELGDEVSRRPAPETTAPLPRIAGGTETATTMSVQIEDRPSTSFEIVRMVLGPLVQPLATTGIVIVFVIFVLLQRRDIRDRFIRLAGARDLMRTTQALEDAGDRVARYLLMQFIVNVTYGVPIGIGLWLIGVPYPLLWGMMATVLRFIPYIGPVLAASLTYMNEDSIPHAKYLIRRLRRRAPAIKIIIGLWSIVPDQLARHEVTEETRADLVTVSLTDTLDQVTSLLMTNEQHEGSKTPHR
jgi:predicted PurR-regulated permease PerM